MQTMIPPLPIAWRKPHPRDEEAWQFERRLDHLATRLGTSRAAFASMPLVEVLGRHAAIMPGSIAAIGRHERLDWATLTARVQALAGVIADRVPPGRAVAVLLPDGPGSLVAVLACAAAGRVGLVMNALHPAARNNTILQHAGAAAVILDDCPPGLILPPGIAVISSKTIGYRHVVLPPTIADAPAFVIYTSGSTGRTQGDRRVPNVGDAAASRQLPGRRLRCACTHYAVVCDGERSRACAARWRRWRAGDA